MGERAETLKANGTEHVQRTLQQVKSCLEIIKLPHRPKATPKIFYDERKRGREKLGEGDWWWCSRRTNCVCWTIGVAVDILRVKKAIVERYWDMLVTICERIYREQNLFQMWWNQLFGRYLSNSQSFLTIFHHFFPTQRP